MLQAHGATPRQRVARALVQRGGLRGRQRAEIPLWEGGTPPNTRRNHARAHASPAVASAPLAVWRTRCSVSTQAHRPRRSKTHCCAPAQAGTNFSKGCSNSVFGSAARHPLWAVVFDVLRNRSATPLLGHTSVLFSTGPAVLREALRRLLRLRRAESISGPMLARLRQALGIVVLDSALLHPVTAERRELARQEDELPPEAVCTHHFVSSWVAHDASQHADTERRRREGHRNAAVEGDGLAVRQDNTW